MLVNLGKIFDRDRVSKRIKAQFDFSNEDFGAGVSFTKPVDAVLDLKKGNREVFLSLSGSAEGDCVCARCLDEFTRRFDFTREYVVTPLTLTEADPEIPVSPSNILDLQRWTYQELCLRLPSVILCGDACLGLCHVCGRPLRDGCKCAEKKTVDSRLAVLTELLNEDE